jgi:hypothetical protein
LHRDPEFKENSDNLETNIFNAKIEEVLVEEKINTKNSSEKRTEPEEEPEDIREGQE